MALAKYPNVVIKAAGLPQQSVSSYPFENLDPYLRKTYDAFGPERIFWGSDITSLEPLKVAYNQWHIKAPLLIHYGELDTGVNAGWPAFEAALKANNKTYEAYIYPAANHGFHNDSTPRYDKAAAKLAWDRTISWFKKYLV